MKALIYEMKKNIFRKYMVFLILAALGANILLIYTQYCQAGKGFSDVITRKVSTEKEWSYYKELHAQFDGTITKEKVRNLTEKMADYEPHISSGDFSTEYDPDHTETGYYYGDYSILETYFYNPIEYLVNYSISNGQLTEKASENIEFYNKTGNSCEEEKNQYILSRYQNRRLTEFYDFQGWKQLISYDYSDLFLFVLLLLAIVPCYYNEQKYKMTEIILASKGQKKAYTYLKHGAVYLWIIGIVFAAASVNFLIIKVLYGLDGGWTCLYALSDYQYTPLNLSLFGFFLFINIMKCLSLIVFARIGFCISGKVKNIYMIYLILLAGMAVCLYCSGFVCSSSPVKQYLTLLNPLSGFQIYELEKGCYGMNVFGHYVPWLAAYLCVQTGILLLSYIIPLFCSGLRKPGYQKLKGWFKRRRTDGSDGM